ncbi:MAG: YeeE/YedE thiosulfate transporter family protein [Parvularculaceae bacterium]
MGLFSGLAILMAAAAGYAAQRGSICTVAATNYLVVNRDARRFLALLACSGWALALMMAAHLFGAGPFENLSTYPPGVLAALGGALFGAGAVFNGACAFGSVARLGGGDMNFTATLVGVVLGAAAVARFVPHAESTPIQSIMPQAATPFAVVVLGVFVAYFLARAVRVVKSVKGALDAITAKRWRPFFAVAVIGVVNAFLATTVIHWPYTSLLVDVASTGSAQNSALKAAMAIALVTGAAIGAHTAGRFKGEPPRIGAFSRKIIAGAVMGAGAFLIPGGNDTLILYGLPLLQPYAMVAYVSMAATMAGLMFFMMKKPGKSV